MTQSFSSVSPLLTFVSDLSTLPSGHSVWLLSWPHRFFQLHQSYREFPSPFPILDLMSPGLFPCFNEAHDLWTSQERLREVIFLSLRLNLEVSSLEAPSARQEDSLAQAAPICLCPQLVMNLSPRTTLLCVLVWHAQQMPINTCLNNTLASTPKV